MRLVEDVIEFASMAGFFVLMAYCSGLGSTVPLV